MEGQKVQQIINEQIVNQLQETLDKYTVAVTEHYLSMDGKPMPVIRRSIDVEVQNGVSGYKYKGINKWLQYHDNESFYYTFLKIQELGGKIKQGSHCRLLFVYIPPKYVEDEKTKQKVCVRGPMWKYHQVFRWQDIEGIERPKTVDDKNNQRAATLEEFLDRVKSKGIRWTEAGNYSSYNEEEDMVHIPSINQFESSSLYYATLFREISKAVGAKPRLNFWKDRRHSDDREELVGEIIAATIMLRYGMDVIPETAGDIKKWMDALNNDEQLFTASMSKAEKVLEFLDTK